MDEPTATAAKLLQSCPTLCNPIDGLLPGSSVPGILQARTDPVKQSEVSQKEKNKYCIIMHTHGI